jgi:hypothetical protein
MRQFKLYCATYVLLFAVFSCKHENYADAVRIYDENFGETIYLEGENVDFDEPLMKPRLLLLVDSIMLVYNMSTESLVYRYNMNTLRKTGEYISFGGGPEDMTGIRSMQRSDSTVWLVDNQSKAGLAFRLADICLKDTFKAQVRLSINEMFNDAWIFPDYRVLTSGFNPEAKRLSFFSPAGELVRRKGDYPSFGSELTNFEKMEGFISQMVVNPRADKIYLFCLSTDLLEIYDLNGELVRRIHGPDHFFPVVQEKRDGEMIRVASKMHVSRDAFISPVIVNDEIFALYSGTYFDIESRNTKDQLLVYDKEGNPLRRYKLSENLFHIAVDAERKIIYGLCDYPEFHMLKFRY